MFNIPCRLVYFALSAICLASSFGLDKSALGAIAAGAYIALALAREH